MSIPLYSCTLDPLTLPVVADPVIVPAVGEMYRHRESGQRHPVHSMTHGRIVWLGEHATLMFPMADFWATFIHASAREDV